MRFWKIFTLLFSVFLFSGIILKSTDSFSQWQSSSDWGRGTAALLFSNNDATRSAAQMGSDQAREFSQVPSGDRGTFPTIITAFMGGNNGCWFCPVFTKLFDAINTISTTVSDNLRGDFIKLLGIGILFYLLFKVLKAVISFGEIDPKEFITELFMPFLKGTIAVVVLYNLGGFYHHVVNPLTELSIGFSTNISEVETGVLGSALSMRSTPSRTINSQPLCSSSSFTPATPTTSERPVFEASVNEAMQCFLKTISTNLIVYMAIAATFIADSIDLGWSKWFPDFSMLFVGICLFVPLFMIFISLPFKLLDSMFRLMFVSALMPLWVILWVLPVTKGYSKKAFDMFLNVLITFVCLSVIMLMVLILLRNWFSGSDINELTSLLYDDRAKDAFKLINFSTSSFFIALAMTFLALSLVGKTDEFVNGFVGGNLGGGMGAGLEKMGMAGIGLVGSKVAKPLATRAAKSMGTSIGKVADKTLESAKSMAKKTPYVAGYAVGAMAKGMRRLNAGPKMTAAQAMTPTGMIPPVSAQNNNKLKVSSSSINSSTDDGGTKESKTFKFTNSSGNKVMDHLKDTVVDRAGNVLSTTSKREQFDPTTGESKGSLTLEKDKVTGEKILTRRDSKGRETEIIMKDSSGKKTVEKNTYDDVSGRRVQFENIVTDSANHIIENFEVKLNAATNKYMKTDRITGTVSEYIVPTS